VFCIPQRWSGPSAIATCGAGLGFQLGAEVTEYVMVLNTDDTVKAFARGGNVTLGGDLSMAAGPVGRTALVAVTPVAAAYSYSRSKRLFAGGDALGSGETAARRRQAPHGDWRSSDWSARPLLLQSKSIHPTNRGALRRCEERPAMIRKIGSKYVLKSSTGNILGKHATKTEVKAQETVINLSKARAAGHHIPRK